MLIEIEPGLHLIEAVGAGASSVVYRAAVVDDMPFARAGTDVAVKVFSRPLRGKQVERFRREFQIGATLRTPYVAQYYAQGLYRTPLESRPYLVMEFVRGRSLAEEISSLMNLQLPDRTRQLSRLIHELLRSLAILEQHNVVHRDIQPGNIRVLNGRPKLLDLGTSKHFVEDGAPVTSVWEELGTRRYWAPECIETRRARWTPATDVFMLGSCLLHLLTGQYLFHSAKNYPEFFAQLKEYGEDLDSDLSELTQISAELRSALLIELMLWPRPDTRPTASELLETLTAPRVPDLRPFEARQFPITFLLWNLASEYSEQDVALIQYLDQGIAENMGFETTVGQLRAMWPGPAYLFGNFLGMLFSFGLLQQVDPNQPVLLFYPDEVVLVDNTRLTPTDGLPRICTELHRRRRTLQHLRSVRTQLREAARRGSYEKLEVNDHLVVRLGRRYYCFESGTPESPDYSLAVYQRRVRPTYLADVTLVSRQLTAH